MQLSTAFEQVIARETVLVDQLIALGQQTQAVINDSDALVAIAQQEEQVIESMLQVEIERNSLFDDLASGQKISEWLETTGDLELRQSVITLREKIVELQAINQQNQLLMQESLAFTQFNLNLLLGDQPQTYTKPGIKTNSRSIFDRKV